VNRSEAMRNISAAARATAAYVESLPAQIRRLLASLRDGSLGLQTVFAPVRTASATLTAGLTRVLPEVEDRAFLPAAVEIIETPPSPHAVTMMLGI